MSNVKEIPPRFDLQALLQQLSERKKLRSSDKPLEAPTVDPVAGLAALAGAGLPEGAAESEDIIDLLLKRLLK